MHDSSLSHSDAGFFEYISDGLKQFWATGQMTLSQVGWEGDVAGTCRTQVTEVGGLVLLLKAPIIVPAVLKWNLRIYGVT